jgi:ubiquinone biosynthesis protein UbiJ
MIALVLGSVERYLNALLEESTAARERLETLAGSSLGLRLVGPGLEILIRAGEHRLHVERGMADSADAVLCGTPLALLQRWGSGDASGFDAGGVRFTGDAQTLEDFVRLLNLLAPEFEDELARVTGDVAAHEVVRLGLSAQAWAARAMDALLLNTGEFLQEESRDLPARHEADSFYSDVERLRDDVARLLARAEGLARSGPSPPAKPGDGA